MALHQLSTFLCESASPSQTGKSRSQGYVTFHMSKVGSGPSESSSGTIKSLGEIEAKAWFYKMPRPVTPSTASTDVTVTPVFFDILTKNPSFGRWPVDVDGIWSKHCRRRQPVVETLSISTGFVSTSTSLVELPTYKKWL